MSPEVTIDANLGVFGNIFENFRIGNLIKSKLFWIVVLIVIRSFVESVSDKDAKLSKRIDGHLLNNCNAEGHRVARGASGQ